MKKESGVCACGCGETTNIAPDGTARTYLRGHNRRGVGKGWIEGGYRYVSIEGQKIAYHRHLMEQHLGRKLTRDEQVHHINGDRLDNRIENLAVLSKAEHTRLHMSGVRKRRWAKAEIERARELRRLGFTIQQVASLA